MRGTRGALQPPTRPSRPADSGLPAPLPSTNTPGRGVGGGPRKAGVRAVCAGHISGNFAGPPTAPTPAIEPHGPDPGPACWSASDWQYQFATGVPIGRSVMFAKPSTEGRTHRRPSMALLNGFLSALRRDEEGQG